MSNDPRQFAADRLYEPGKQSQEAEREETCRDRVRSGFHVVLHIGSQFRHKRELKDKSRNIIEGCERETDQHGPVRKCFFIQNPRVIAPDKVSERCEDEVAQQRKISLRLRNDEESHKLSHQIILRRRSRVPQDQRHQTQEHTNSKDCSRLKP